MSRTNAIYEWRCTGCGLRLRGKLVGGRIVASDYPAHDERVRDCLCTRCQETGS